MFHPVKQASVLWAIIIAAIIGWSVMLFLLHKLRSREKKYIVVATTFIGGLFYVLQFFLPAKIPFFGGRTINNPFDPLIDPIGIALSVVAAFTFMLGVGNLTLVHGRNVLRRQKGWYNSAAFFVALVLMIGIGLAQAYVPETNQIGGTVHRIYDVLFDGMYVSLNSTMFSLLAFYMATAAFRAFRLRSGEATLLVIAAFLVMIGQVPIGMWLTSSLPDTGWLASLRAERIALELQSVIAMAGLRAVNFGVGIGGLAISLRLWLNLERGAFFEQEF